MDMVNARNLAGVMGVAAQRILSIQHSAANSGKTEESVKRELLPPEGASLAPGGFSCLK